MDQLGLEQAARKVVNRLQEAGFEGVYAGGCVRDMLLGKAPHDYDVASSAKPEQVQSLFRRTVAVGAQFGVVCVLEGPHEVQVATFRSDGEYSDGRHPESVSFSDAKNDALRRDGTLTVADLDVVEINEAFASVGLASMRDLGLAEDKVNVNGGAIAIGHPVGMSGARILLSAAYELKKRGGGTGAVGLCGGGGQGEAIVFTTPA